ncbi:dihydrodipicolinate synthase family protein [Sinomonas susongensis]|uniref:dihydrodipicolinate synthase family protein n=1 Tax=Sinomonas susongensis TaxID=1324851 RepID=UPI00110A03D7|nr:dihydrodipicolinate synthase family protein [Sinomonas susongensis]
MTIGQEHAAPLERGVWGVVPTPFAGSARDVDTGSLAGLVEHYEAVGAVGLTVLGVFGEAAALSIAEKSLVLETAAEASSLPIVAGVAALATRPAIDEATAAQQVLGRRLKAVMVQANSPDPDVLATHLEAIHRATGAAVVVQDYPAASGVAVPAATLADAVRRAPFVAAVKAEAPPTALAIARLTALLEVPVFGGLGGQGLLDELAAGAAGAMTGFSCPEALVATVRAFVEGGPAAARRTFAPFLPLVNLEQQPRLALALRKTLFRERGLIADAAVRPPSAPLPDELLPILREQLDGARSALTLLDTAVRIG